MSAYTLGRRTSLRQRQSSSRSNRLMEGGGIKSFRVGNGARGGSTDDPLSAYDPAAAIMEMHEESTAKKGRAGWMALFGVLAIATIAYFAFGGKLGGPSDEDGSTAARPADRRLKQTPFHHDHQHQVARKLAQYTSGDARGGGRTS